MSCGDQVKGCLIKKETQYDGSGPGLKRTALPVFLGFPARKSKGNAREIFSRFPTRNSDTWFPGLGKAAVLGICRFSWGRKSNNSGSAGGGDQFFFKFTRQQITVFLQLVQ